MVVSFLKNSGRFFSIIIYASELYFWTGKSRMYTCFTHLPIDSSLCFLCLQLVQRINSIYCTKRGKKRLKKLSMSNVETTSLRGKGSSFLSCTGQTVSKYLSFCHPHRVPIVLFMWYLTAHVCEIDIWPLKNLLVHLLSVSRWQQREWEWLWRQVQRWVTAEFIGKGQELEFLHSCFCMHVCAEYRPMSC